MTGEILLIIKYQCQCGQDNGDFGTQQSDIEKNNWWMGPDMVWDSDEKKFINTNGQYRGDSRGCYCKYSMGHL